MPTQHYRFHFGDIVRLRELTLPSGISTGLLIEKDAGEPNMYKVLVGTKLIQLRTDQFQFVRKSNYRQAKIQFLFSQESREFHKHVRYDEVALYSATDQLTAMAITNIILSLPNVTTDSVVTDATSCIGGNVIEFVRTFSAVNAVEIDPQRIDMLRYNLDFLSLLPKVTLHCNDYCKVHDKIQQDVVFIDPPWGGRSYKQQQQVELSLGECKIGTVCKNVLQHTKHVVTKVPSNYSVQAFAKVVGCRVRVLRLSHTLLILIVSSELVKTEE